MHASWMSFVQLLCFGARETAGDVFVNIDSMQYCTVFFGVCKERVNQNGLTTNYRKIMLCTTVFS